MKNKSASQPQPTVTNADLAAMIGQLDKKFDRKFSGLDHRFNGLDGKFNGLDSKFTHQIENLAKHQIEMRAELKQDIQRSQDEVIAVIRDVVQITGEKIDSLDKRTTKLERAVFQVG